ncbi:unnamed protein product [Rotaria magnacalcarata]|uniref:Uncharacterized protein n=1 Tax=Rotaria magnacalcarata TaxID=392030 RepID=A0A815V840_9BILA|nr:unnamed protein product [Rotaria magnacalcarata]
MQPLPKKTALDEVRKKKRINIPIEVQNRYRSIIKMTDTNDKIRIDQVHIETAIPAIDSFSIDVTLLTSSMTDTRIKNTAYEDICQLVEQYLLLISTL